MEKTYTFAGTARYKGEELNYRFGSGKISVRTGILERDGHTDVKFLVLPRPMTLVDATRWLNAQGIRAVMPTGHRRREDERRIGMMREAIAAAASREAEEAAARAVVVDAEAQRKADFVARMAAARAAKRAAREAVGA